MIRVFARSTIGRTVAASLGALATLGVAAHPGAAQDVDRMAKLEPSCRVAIETVFDSAAIVGLPVSALRSVANQGISRKVDCRDIAKEVRRQYGFLRTAQATLGAVDSGELAAAADVLRAGARANQLASFKPQQKGQTRLEAFAIWTDLLTRGVPGEDAYTGITKLWQDGADDATFFRLWKNVQSDILQGLNPGTALQNRIRETPGRASPQPVKPPEGPQENQSSR